MDFFKAIPIFFKNLKFFAIGGVLVGAIDAILRVFVWHSADSKFIDTPLLAILVGLLLAVFAVAIGVIVFGFGIALALTLREGFLSKHSWKYSLICGGLYLVGLPIFSKLPFDWPLVYILSAILCIAIFYLLVLISKLIEKSKNSTQNSSM